MNYKVLAAAGLIAVVTAQAGAVDESLPAPWVKDGASPAVEQCVAGIDTELERQGTPNLTLRCDTAVEGFVSVAQSFAASDYRSKRVRFSALVKSESIEGWGGLWMRVDEEGRPGASFDNMHDRAIEGTTDWTPYSVVLDASPDAQGIAFGTLMSGKGQLWISNVRFEVVGPDEPLTGRVMARERGNLELSRKPANLELAR